MDFKPSNKLEYDFIDTHHSKALGNILLVKKNHNQNQGPQLKNSRYWILRCSSYSHCISFQQCNCCVTSSRNKYKRKRSPRYPTTGWPITVMVAQLVCAILRKVQTSRPSPLLLPVLSAHVHLNLYFLQSDYRQIFPSHRLTKLEGT